MKLLRLLGITLLYMAIFSSCSQGTGVNIYVHYDGIALRLEYSTEGSASSWSSTTFTLERPISFFGNENAIAVSIPQWSDPIKVEALTGGGNSTVTIAAQEFSPRDADAVVNAELRLSVPSGATVSGIRISGGGKASAPRVDRLSTESAIRGTRYSVETDSYVVGTFVPQTVVEGNPSTSYSYDLRRLVFPDSVDPTQIVVDISYRYPKKELMHIGIADSPDVLITWKGSANRSRQWSLKPRAGHQTIHLFESVNGVMPQYVDIKVRDRDFVITGFEVRRMSTLHAGRSTPDLIPLRADFGSIILYDQQYWRNGDFELFSWNLYPSILLIDLESYDLQSRYFKRLAFFVEKASGAGRLLTNEELEGLHGWNAHDYWAPDLARFYRAADAIGFVLNEEEEYLREILYERGVLVRTNPVQAGEGAILSISQESSDYLRRIFINHEGYHGLYFASEGYRKAVAAAWNSQTEGEKQFWRYFLAWKNYDVSNEELLINEFQAYLMQQATSLVDGYFIEYNIPRMSGFLGDAYDEVQDIVSEHPDMFRRAAELVENAAYRETGVMAFDLLDISPYEQ